MSDPALPPSPPAEPVEWTPAGPVSPRFGDVYFSAVDGLEESRAVFLQGCGLPQAWAGRRRFVVGELGFGTGLNILALLQLWAAHRPSSAAHLSIFSVEGFPLGADDAERALARWPEVSALARPLLAAWPKGRRGLHRIEWPELGATLDLIVGDVLPAVQGWTGAADAWFLDGFAPAKNPQMWSEEVLTAVAARSAPGARLATFTVAGAVRRGLHAQGFEVEKRAGFGLKRERLEAWRPEPAVPDPPLPSVAVIGAGIAGAALVRALRRQRIEPVLVEAEGAGAGASGNAAALVTPRLDAGGGVVARLHAEAFARAVALYGVETPGAVLAGGALQLESTGKDAARFPRIAAFDGFDPGAVTPRLPSEVAACLEEAVAPGGLSLREARVLEPRGVLDIWLAGVEVARRQVFNLRRDGPRWLLLDADDASIGEADVIVLATGPALAALVPSLAVRPVRGQASTADVDFLGVAAAWGGYAIPTRDGFLYGASHGPGDDSADLRPAEASDNLARLAQGRPALAAQVAAAPAAARADRASVRATLPDHLPVAGELVDRPGLFVLGGLGGRGFTLAPLLAEHVAARIAGAPSPLSWDIEAALSPNRRSARCDSRSRTGTAAPRPRSASTPSTA